MQLRFGSVFVSEQTIGLFSIRSIDIFFFIVSRYKPQPNFLIYAKIENASPRLDFTSSLEFDAERPQCEPKRTTPFFFPLDHHFLSFESIDADNLPTLP